MMIKNERDKRGWSRTEMVRRAAVLGLSISEATIIRAEEGDAISSGKRQVIAQVLGVPHDDLFPEVQDAQN